MEAFFGSIIAIVFIVLAMNFILLFLRMRKNPPRKSSRKAPNEDVAAVWRDKEIQRRLEREQDSAERIVELRNKTFELYELVRRNAELAEAAEIARIAEIAENGGNREE
jgi:predicted Holliday junction resolvase-like endonuclease